MAVREVHPELPSTQDRAIELARAGAEAGSVVVARRQRRGRGRDGRSWESPAGGLYLSVVLRPARPPAFLPLAVGAAVADALAREYGVRLRLKWPNDLLAVDGAGVARKLAGVLIDIVTGPDDRRAAVVGIGVNVRSLVDVPPELRGHAVSLEELAGTPVDLERLERTVTEAVGEAGRSVEPTPTRPDVVQRVRGLLYGVGETVTVDGSPAGVVRTVSDDGALEVVGPHGVVTIHVGDVRVGFGP